MKTIIEKGKWTETTTKVYTIKKIGHNPYLFSDNLINSTKELFRPDGNNYKRRMNCNCCKKRWENDEPIYLCFTDKENKLICGDCKSKLS